jgi:WD40 repeat protein/Flp pilus assembly protein TadD
VERKPPAYTQRLQRFWCALTELDWIVMKALEKDRSRRYETANGLAADIERYLNDEPVVACPPSTVYMLRKFASRHRGLVAAAAVFAILILIAGSLLWYERSQTFAALARVTTQRRLAQEQQAVANRERADALDARALAKEQEKLAKQHEELAQRQRDAAEYDLYVSNIRLATHDWTGGRTTGLRDSLDALFPEPGRPDYRGWEWYYLYSLFHRDRFTFRLQDLPSAKSETIDWSPDGENLATVDATGLINIWDISNGQLKASLEGCPGTIHSISWSPDDKHLAVGGDRRIIVVWDLASGDMIQTLRGHTASVRRVDWNPDGVRLASGGDDGMVLVWDSHKGEKLTSVGGDQGQVLSLDWHPDGNQLLAIVGFEPHHTLRIWDTASGDEAVSLVTGYSNGAAFGPDGSRVVFDGHVTDLKTQEKVSSAPRQAILRGGNWSPNGQRLAAPTEGETGITIWDVETGGELSSIPSPGTRLVTWSPDGRHIASAAARDVKVFDATTIPSPLTLSTADRYALCVAFSPDGRRLLAGTQRGMLKVWDVESGEETLSIRQPGPFWNLSVAWSPDGTRFASGSGRGVRIHDAVTGKQMLPPLDCGDTAATLDWRPDGKVLAVGYYSRQFGEIRVRVMLWDADTGREVATSTYAKGAGEYSAIAWRPDGGQLVAGSAGCLRVWDSELREETVVDTGEGLHKNRSLDWSPDGKRLASCMEQQVILYDATDWTPIRVIKLGASEVRWHPHGSRIAFAIRGTISIWDTSTGRQVWTCDAHAKRLDGLDWSPDGMRLASASWDRTVRIWDASPADRFLKTHGDLREKVGKYQGALDLLLQLQELHPEEQLLETQLARVRWGHANKLAKSGRTDEAIAACKQLTAEWSDLPDYRLRLPSVLFESGRQTEAIELLEGFVTEFLETPQYRDELAYLYERRATKLCRSSKFDEATPILLKLAEEFPNRPDFRAQLAFQTAKAERLEDTMATFEKLAEAFSDRADYRPELARHLAATGGYAAAVTLYETLVAEHPDRPDYRGRLGSCLLAGDRLDQGMAVLQKLVNEFPDLSEYRSELGNAYRRRGSAHTEDGDLDEAIADFSKAIELKPDEAVVWENRAGAYASLGRWDEAAADYARLVKLDSASHYPWYQYAMCCVAARDAEGYGKACTGMLDQFDRGANTLEERFTAWTCALAPDAVADYAPALELAQRTVEAEPSVTNQQGFGAVLYRAERFGEAVETLSKIDDDDDENSEACSPAYGWYFLAMAHHAAGHADEAAQWLDKANALSEEELSAEDVPWNRRLTLDLLRNEAEALLEVNQETRQDE